MKPTEDAGKRVSTLSRVLAWIVVLCGVFAGVAWATDFRANGLPPFSAEIFIALLSVAIIMPLFLYVALKGRSPRWLTSMEGLYEARAKRRGIRVSRTDASRRLGVGVASVVFGLGLFAFGTQVDLFSGETGWFAMTVFAVAWLIVVAILWRSFGRRPGN